MTTRTRKATAILFLASGLALTGCESTGDQPENKDQQMPSNNQQNANQTKSEKKGNPNDYIGNGAFGEPPP